MNKLLKLVLAFSMVFTLIHIQPTKASSEPATYPSVQSYETSGEGSFTLSNSSRFFILVNDKTIQNKDLENDVKLMSSEYFAKGLTTSAMNIHVGIESEIQAGDIVIVMEEISETSHQEGYKIVLDENATITAPNVDGLFNGMRTLQRGLIANDKAMPYGTIIDYPGVEERSFHLDAARKYFSVDWIKALIKDLSYQGFSSLQFHFSENEGYRFESETLEALDGWNYPSDGYYTKDQLSEIIQLAKQYHIDFYPSFDTPGHADYILNYLPSSWDITDKWPSDFRSTQVFDIFDEPEAKAFVASLFHEYAKFFSEQGCKYFNIGGDEFLNNFNLMSNDQYKKVIDYFNEMAAIVKSYGMIPRAWNDGIMFGDYTGYELDPDIQICYWSGPSGTAKITKFMENGNKVMNYSDAWMYYVLGQWWMSAANPSGERVYNEWQPGMTPSPGDVFEVPYPENFLGASFAVWCDTPSMLTEAQIASNIFMRTRAMSEKSWNPTKAVGTYSTFETLVNKVGRVAGYDAQLPNPGSVTYTENIGKVTLKFVDENNDTIQNDKEYYGILTSEYNLFDKVNIYGYRVLNTSDALIGTYEVEDKVITIQYELYTDYSQLEALLENELVEQDYIAETYGAYKEAYAKASAIYANKDAHQSVVDEAVEELSDAIKKTVSIENYALYVETAYPLTNSGYTSGYDAYQSAVKAAKEVLYDENSNASALDAALQSINQAKANLVQNSGDANISISATLSAYTTYVYSNMLDGNMNTKCWFDNAQVAGDSITFTFDKAVNMSSMTITQPSNVGADVIDGADIMVAGSDGVFSKVGSMTASDLSKTVSFTAREVKTVKIVLTASKDNWYQISEVSFVYEDIEADTTLKDMIVEAESLEIAGKDNTLVHNMINALINAQKVYVNNGSGENEKIALRSAIDALLDGEVNKGPLNALISQVNALDESAYTSVSWNTMKEVYDRANALYNNEEATQVEVSAMVVELKEAMDALEKVGDKTALQALIEEAEDIDLDRASAESVATLEEALNVANIVLAKQEASQAEVDEAIENLQDAIDGLDFGELKAENLINTSANSGVSIVSYSSEYTPESQTAAKVLDYNNSSFWHSNWAGTDTLPQYIIFDLGKTYDVSDITFLPRQDGTSYNGDILEAQILVGDSIDNLSNTGTYTFETTGSGVNTQLANRSEFKRIMLENACGRYVKFVVTKSAADTAAGQNQWATMAEIRFYGKEPSTLEPANKDALNASIAAAEQLVENDYTEDSWNAVAESLAAAKVIAEKEDATQEEVDAALVSLDLAMEKLEEKPDVQETNKTVLKAILDLCETKLAEADKYTDESIAELQRLYNLGMMTYNEPTVSQEVVNSCVARLQEAIAALEEKPLLSAPTKVENLVAEDTNYKTVTLTWDAVEGATAYDVYRKSYKEGATFELETTVEEPTYESVGVMTGKEYAFYVVAKNDAGAAEASEEVAMATTLKGTVTLGMEKVSTSKFHLSWNKVDGATRYIVYRKRNDDKMKKVLTLGGDVLEYTTAEMPNGDYQFQVKAGRYDSVDRVMTGASNKVNGSVEALKPSVTATAGTKSAKISWKKMEGVTHYQVYRATSSTGKYTKLVTTKELSYTAKSLTKGKKYYFKVRGYKTYKSGTDIKYTVYTPYSSVKSVTAK